MSFKILGHAALSATTDTTIYTVAGGKSAVLSTVSVCNRGATAVTYRLALVPSGATLDTSHYVAYEATLPAYSTDYHRAGFTLAAGDFVVARCSTADLTVVVCGDET